MCDDGTCDECVAAKASDMGDMPADDTSDDSSEEGEESTEEEEESM